MYKYIGLTIGPIYPTLKQARSTRELWGASYLFSSIFRQIAVKLKNHVILPYVDESGNYPVGLYPDRIILKQRNDLGEALSITEVHKAINDAFTKIAEDVIKITSSNNLSKAIEQLQRSIQIHAYELEIPYGQNIIFKLFSQLDNMELFNQLPSTVAIIPQYFTKINESKLYEDAGWPKKKRFPSLFDISAYSLSIKYLSEYDSFIKKHFKEKEWYDQTGDSDAKLSLESFIRNCQIEFGTDFKPYHKYFALVHADGDNMGRIVSSIGSDEEKIMKFSKALFDFGKEAGDIISNYGGLPVYIGGDDLLFFAPLANDQRETPTNILELIKKLDDNFSNSHCPKIMNLLDDKSVTPSFSYGVSINFFKYPLKESFEYSYNNLLKAKSDLFKNKNSVVITLQKHQGQQIEAGIKKNDPFYTDHLLVFIRKHCFSKYADEYNSFRQKSAEYHPLLKNLPTYHGTVSNFIRKNFDHDFSKGYWKDLLDILIVTYSDPAEADKRIEMLYFAIRFIHFINSDTNE